MRLRAFKLSLSEEIDPFCLGVGWSFGLVCSLEDFVGRLHGQKVLFAVQAF